MQRFDTWLTEKLCTPEVFNHWLNYPCYPRDIVASLALLVKVLLTEPFAFGFDNELIYLFGDEERVLTLPRRMPTMNADGLLDVMAERYELIFSRAEARGIQSFRYRDFRYDCLVSNTLDRMGLLWKLIVHSLIGAEFNKIMLRVKWVWCTALALQHTMTVELLQLAYTVRSAALAVEVRRRCEIIFQMSAVQHGVDHAHALMRAHLPVIEAQRGPVLKRHMGTDDVHEIVAALAIPLSVAKHKLGDTLGRACLEAFIVAFLTNTLASPNDALAFFELTTTDVNLIVAHSHETPNGDAPMANGAEDVHRIIPRKVALVRVTQVEPNASMPPMFPFGVTLQFYSLFKQTPMCYLALPSEAAGRRMFPDGLFMGSSLDLALMQARDRRTNLSLVAHYVASTQTRPSPRPYTSVCPALLWCLLCGDPSVGAHAIQQLLFPETASSCGDTVPDRCHSTINWHNLYRALDAQYINRRDGDNDSVYAQCALRVLRAFVSPDRQGWHTVPPVAVASLQPFRHSWDLVGAGEIDDIDHFWEMQLSPNYIHECASVTMDLSSTNDRANDPLLTHIRACPVPIRRSADIAAGCRTIAPCRPMEGAGRYSHPLWEALILTERCSHCEFGVDVSHHDAMAHLLQEPFDTLPEWIPSALDQSGADGIPSVIDTQVSGKDYKLGTLAAVDPEREHSPRWGVFRPSAKISSD